MLERGGNAVDAAVAIAAVLAVVEPHASGLGGDLVALVAEGGNGRIWTVDGSGLVPPEITIASELPFPERGPQSIAVPAAARAWQLLHERWGTLPLDVVLAPAIELAGNGFPVGHTLAASVAGYRGLLARDPRTAAIFLPGGAPLVPGAILRQPALARTLKTLARVGLSDLYEGATAAQLIRAIGEAGGTHSAERFARAYAEVIEPDAVHSRGWTVYGPRSGARLPPLLTLLGILDHLPLAHWKPLSADLLHALIEAAKLAWHATVADAETRDIQSRTGSAPLVPERLYQLAAAIDPRHARRYGSTVSGGAEGSTAFAVVDERGILVVAVATLHQPFGSGVVAGDTGILLNNGLALYHRTVGRYPGLARGERVPLLLCPTILVRGDRMIGLGTAGSEAQLVVPAHVFVHALEYGYTLQEAVELPRWQLRTRMVDWMPGRYTVDVVEVEGRLPNATIEGLQARGHRVERLSRWGPIGACQVVVRQTDPVVLEAAADPRADACALAW